MKKKLLAILVLAIVLGIIFFWQKEAQAPVAEIKFISPAAGEVWKIGGNYTIKLNESLLASGEDMPWHRMFLVGQDGKQIGIIACVKGDPAQTEWNWEIDTLIGFCGAGDHKPIEVQPGVYKLQLLHDTPEQEVTAESAYFTLAK